MRNALFMIPHLYHLCIADHIYVCGGFDGTVRHTSMERYDALLDQWDIVGNMRVGREGAGLVVC